MNHFTSSLAFLCAPLFFTNPASAQCFNLDVGDPGAGGAGVPSNGYAAAGMPGVWNTAGSATSYSTSIVSLSGGGTAVTTSVAGGGNDFSQDNVLTLGDDEALLDDLQDVGGVGSVASWTFNGLTDGPYEIFTYTWAPDSTAFISSVTIGGSTVTMAPTDWTGAHIEGNTYARHSVNVVGGSVSIDIETISGFASVNGFQFMLGTCGVGGGGGPLLVAEEQVLFASDAAAQDEFSRCVAMSGDTLAVGARHDNDRGSVYVFDRSGGTWTQSQKLVALDGLDGDDFGECVAISGNTIVIGAPGVSVNGANSGAVYVFTRAGNLWGQQGGRLFGSDVDAEDHFGESVGVDGDTLVAGARFDDGSGMFNSGNAYVFTRSGFLWTEDAELSASDAQNFDQFGVSVTVSGNTVAVGAAKEDALGPDAGAVYVFVDTGASWTQQAKLTAAGGTGLDEFGAAVSLDGDLLAIGAPYADRSTTNPGAAYVFLRTGVNWNQEQKLLSGDFMGNDRFGASVSISNPQLVVGAPFDSHLGVAQGSAYVWLRAGSVWTQESKLIASDGVLSDRFGGAVAIDGDNVGVGAWENDAAAGEDQGAAYTYRIQHATLQDFCFGDGGDQMGCTNCPCGNNARPGTRGGCINGVGTAGRLGGFGTPSVANDTLRFEGIGFNPSTFAALFSNALELPSSGACPPGSGVAQPALLDGLRCGGQTSSRHGTRATSSEGTVGLTNNGWGPPNGPPGGLVAQANFAIGQTRFFSVFYREDPGLSCGTGTNTSNGVRMTVLP